jgi:hypothetical protein
MRTFTFICHRPYHYFVAAVLAIKKKQIYPNSTFNCINFDVYTFSGKNKKVNYTKNCNLSTYDNLLTDITIFDDTQWLSRKGEQSIWNIVSFYKYYNQTIQNYRDIIKGYSDCDNLYIFSDKEKPVEIMSLLLIEMFNPKVYLIDEGMVSYYYQNNIIKKVLKSSLVQLLQLKYITDNYNYGESKIFDVFITYDKTKIAIPILSKILEMPPIDFNCLRHYMTAKFPVFDNKSVLFISTPLTEPGSITERELNNMKSIINKWEMLGYRVIIKLHPLENIDKYVFLKNYHGTVIVDEKNIPPEIFYGDVTIITGFSSSAVLNASRLKNKIVISYNLIFNWDIKNSHLLMKKHSINYITDLEEIKYIIRSPKNYYTQNLQPNIE